MSRRPPRPRFIGLFLLCAASGCATVLYAAAEQSEGDFPPRQVGRQALVATEVVRRDADHSDEYERYTYRGGTTRGVVFTRYYRRGKYPELIQRSVQGPYVPWPPAHADPAPRAGPNPGGERCQWRVSPPVNVEVRLGGRTEAALATSWYIRCGEVTTVTYEIGAPTSWYTLVMSSDRTRPDLTEFSALARNLLGPLCTGCRFDTP